jgi:hypothetical protein
MNTLLSDARRAIRGSLGHRPWWIAPTLVFVFAPIIGSAIGSFSVDRPERAWLMLFSAVKMPLLLLATSALCAPGFFVLHVVLGVRRDFPAACRAVLCGQAVFAMVLASCAPMVVVFYSAIESKRAALVGLSLLFAAASWSSVFAVRRAYRSDVPDRIAHRVLPIAWMLMYSFVGMQMGWMLRPFVGSKDIEPAFLREDPLTNGYVVVFGLFFGDGS